MKLIVGLGNPGLFYKGNRHNIGFMCIEHFARTYKIKLDKKLGQARAGAGTLDGAEIILARPQTFMNASGQAVAWLMKKFYLASTDLIVIHDDLDLPLGKIRIRQGGSAGGHRGIASIIASIGTPDFVRIRVGIGRPQERNEDEVIDHVLTNFSTEEKKTVEQAIVRVSEALTTILDEGLAAAMNEFNQTPKDLLP